MNEYKSEPRPAFLFLFLLPDQYCIQALFSCLLTSYTTQSVLQRNLNRSSSMSEYKGKCHCGQTEWMAKVETPEHILWSVLTMSLVLPFNTMALTGGHYLAIAIPARSSAEVPFL